MRASLLVVGLLAATPALAADIRQGGVLTIPAGEVVSDDLYLAGSEIHVLGTVDGDLVVAGSAVVVSGVVNGDVIVAGNSIHVGGDVLGSVRAAGADVLVDGEVAQDVLVAGSEVRVPMRGTIGRDLVLTAREAVVEGHVGRRVRASAATFVLGSQVGGDVEARAGRLRVAPGARVEGDLRYGAREVTIDDAARVHGQTVRTEGPEARGGVGLAIVSWLRALVGMLVAGLLFVALFPQLARRAEHALRERPLPSLAAGLVLMVGLPLAAVLIGVVGAFVGGWWIGLVALAALGLASLAGVFVAGVTLGRWLLERVGRPARRLGWGLAAGLVLLLLVGAIPVVGGLAVLAALLFGLGALALAGVDVRRQATA